MSTPGAIRTRDLCLRRAALYPAELRALGVAGPERPACSARVVLLPTAPRRAGSARNKPSSVRRVKRASRRWPARGGIISLGPTLLPASCGLPGIQTARAAPHPLFGLAPGWVCRATPVTSGPVRSYRTLSPLPVPPGGPSAVCSLRHFPSPRDARALPGTLPCGARTFLRQRLGRPAGDPYSRAPHGRETRLEDRVWWHP